MCITCYFATQAIMEAFNFTDATSEEIFYDYILKDDVSIPPEVGQIHGIEGMMFGYAGPAYIHFQATDEFITEILERGYFEPFSEIPCRDFLETSSKYFVKTYPKKFEWWRPTEVTSPICYRAQGGQFDDAEYFLVGNEGESIYFYRTPICGLCPD